MNIMKTKNILLLAAFATTFILSGCKQEEPFDTQSPDDAPLILKPYNESGTGSFTYVLANPDTPLFDSVTVTPSRYTTVKWYLDDLCVCEGVKINQCFQTGTYALVIEAVTEKGKSTKRTGTVIVNPYAEDPYSAAPAAGRHLVPGAEMSIEGQNLSKVVAMVFTSDLYGKNEVATVEPSAKTDELLTFTLPTMADGAYYLRLKDAENKLYGSDMAYIHNAAVALAGYDAFVPNEEWVITGINLQDVASVKLDDVVITTLTATATSVTLIAPDAAEGEHSLSMQNKDGSAVLFITSAGTVDQAVAIVTSDVLATVPLGSTINVYFDVIEAEYHALRITTPWWGDGTLASDLVPQIDGMENNPSPHTFTYDERCKGLVDERGAMCVVGFGLQINKITYK